MKRSFLQTLCLIAVVLLMAACGATKKTVQPQLPQHKTAETKRATVKVQSGGNRLSVGCQLQTVFDSVCVVSVQPLGGMEMYAIHATPGHILVIDRMHRQYAITDYQTLNAFVTPQIDFQMLQRMVSGSELPQGVLTLTRRFAAGRHEAEVTITYPEIRYDQPIVIRPRNIENYKKTDIKTLITNLL